MDDLQFFNNGKDTTVWPDGLAYNGSAVNVTYVSGQNSGFAFNFTGKSQTDLLKECQFNPRCRGIRLYGAQRYRSNVLFSLL